MLTTRVFALLATYVVRVVVDKWMLAYHKKRQWSLNSAITGIINRVTISEQRPDKKTQKNLPFIKHTCPNILCLLLLLLRLSLPLLRVQILLPVGRGLSEASAGKHLLGLARLGLFPLPLGAALLASRLLLPTVLLLTGLVALALATEEHAQSTNQPNKTKQNHRIFPFSHLKCQPFFQCCGAATFLSGRSPRSLSRLRLRPHWVGSGSRQKRRLRLHTLKFFVLSS